MIDAASQELRARVSELLSREHLAAGEITSFDTPRRLAVMASGIPAAQADVTEQTGLDDPTTKSLRDATVKYDSHTLVK